MNSRFGGAPLEVRDAVAKWLRSGRRARRACRVLDEWIEVLAKQLDRVDPPRPKIAPRGIAHDLGELRRTLLDAELSGETFSTGAAPDVTWGRRGRRPARHSLQLGSYDPQTDVVRIHPVLDQDAVPRFFVRYVLFHELLHAVLPTPTAGKRRVHHGAAFRRRERTYRDYARAVAWQEEHLSALIRSARTGDPLRRKRRSRPLTTGIQGLLFPV